MPTTIHLTTADDTYTTAAGDYSIYGEGGNDTITTGAGNSSVYTGAGNSTITTGAGNSIVSTGLGNQTITTGAGDSTVTTLAGNSTITTGAGNNTVTAGNGNNTITTGAGLSHVTTGIGDDTITTGAGDAVVDSGTGNDTVTTGAGNDLVFYHVTNNQGTHSFFTAGAGIDTLNLVMTRAEWMTTAVQADVVSYMSFLAAHKGATGEDDAAAFTFSAFGLTASQFEKLAVTVDGVLLLEPTNQHVSINNASISTTEETASVAVDVLAGATVPDLIQSFSFTNPLHGSLVLNADYLTTANTPSAKFIYSPTVGFYDYLAVGEAASDVFTYTVTDAAGGVHTATVNVTINGTNEAPVLGAAVLTGAVTEQVVATGPLTSSGTINFSDVDLSDTHSVSAAAASGTLGTLTATVSTDDSHTTGVGGVVTWNYSVDNAKVQYLAAGQTKVETFTVTLDDHHGGVVPSTVSVTITGTNEAPVIDTSSSFVGTVTEQVTATPQLIFSENFNGTGLTGNVGYQQIDTNLPTSYMGTLADWQTTSEGPHALHEVERSPGNVAVMIWQADTATQKTPVAANLSCQSYQVSFEIAPAGWTNGAPDQRSTADDKVQISVLNSSGTVIAHDEIGGGAMSAGATFKPYSFNYVGDGSGDVHLQIRSANPTDGHFAGAIDNISIGTLPTVTSTGAINFSDVDLNDSHTVSAVTSAAGTLGTLTASVSTDDSHSTGLGGVVTWNYSVGNSLVQYLAAGETKVETFTVTLDDGHGGSVPSTVKVTITGTNEAPVLGTAVLTGAVTEQVTATGPLTRSGTITFSDVDLSDTHSVTAVADSGTLGNLTAIVSTDDSHTTGLGGVVTWAYSVDNAKVQYLAAGQTKVETFTVSLDDGHGGVVPSTVSVTITGTNEAPVLAVAPIPIAYYQFSDRTNLGLDSSGNGNNLVAFGSGVTYTANGEYGGGLSLDGHGGLTTLNGLVPTGTPLGSQNYTLSAWFQETGSPGALGIVGWGNYGTVNQVNALRLGNGSENVWNYWWGHDVGSAAPQVYDHQFHNVAVTYDGSTRDMYLDGKLVATDHAVGLDAKNANFAIGKTVGNEYFTGVLDNVAIFNTALTAAQVDALRLNANAAGAVTEQVITTGPLTSSGTITFSDVDLSDIHTASAVAVASSGTLGTLTASVSTDDNHSTGLGGVVTWAYSVDNAKVQYLAAGETKVETFTVTLDDHHGGAVPSTVSVTINGTNEAPVIGTATSSFGGAVTEQVISTGPLTSSGTINFSDVDLTDAHSVNAVAALDTLGTLTASMTTDVNHSTGLGGVFTWAYSVDNAKVQYLAAGETKVETFTVTLDDHHGGVVPSTVSVTINGANEAPVISAADVTGVIYPLYNNEKPFSLSDLLHLNGLVAPTVDSAYSFLFGSTGGHTSYKLDGKYSGTIKFADGDLSDHHIVSVNGNNSDGNFGILKANLIEDKTGSGGGGTIEWNYVLPEHDALLKVSLAAPKIDSFNVVVDDQHGGAVIEVVNIKLIGAAYDLHPPGFLETVGQGAIDLGNQIASIFPF